jgi:phosphatidylcholine synthase
VLAAWLVHLYTASSAVLAFVAAKNVIEYRYRNAFFWLLIAVVIDSTDGLLARMAHVSERLPWFHGAKLDDIVDYLTYVFVPALFVWRAVLVPDSWTLGVVSAMLLSSAYGFNRADAKTSDHFFTGFPSYWNIVVFYLFLAGWRAPVNAVILVVCAALVFVPIRYVYPSRTTALRSFTVVFGVVWGFIMLFMLWRAPAIPRPVFWASFAFPIYYVGLSIYLMCWQSERRSRRQRHHTEERSNGGKTETARR